MKKVIPFINTHLIFSCHIYVYMCAYEHIQIMCAYIHAQICIYVCTCICIYICEDSKVDTYNYFSMLFDGQPTLPEWFVEKILLRLGVILVSPHFHPSVAFAFAKSVLSITTVSESVRKSESPSPL